MNADFVPTVLTKKNFSRIHPSGLEPQSFLSKGYAALLPDSRGEGESGGRFLTYGVKEGDDVRRWFVWLAAQKHPRCIFGMGESMGAAILLQSVREETRFCAVIAESSFASSLSVPGHGWANLLFVLLSNWHFYMAGSHVVFP